MQDQKYQIFLQLKDKIQQDYYIQYLHQDIKEVFDFTENKNEINIATATQIPTPQELEKRNELETKLMQKIKSNLFDYYKMIKATEQLQKIIFNPNTIFTVLPGNVPAHIIPKKPTQPILLSSYRSSKSIKVSEYKIEDNIIYYKLKNQKSYRYSPVYKDNLYLYNQDTNTFYYLQANN